MFKQFIIVVFISLSIQSFAGNHSVLDSTGIEKKGGKTFIVHKVDPKETLYSISKRYNVTVDEIKKANDDLTKDLKVGQVILVPTKQVSTAVVRPSFAKTHTVEAKETFYSISKKYGITIDQLKILNPEVDQNDMKVGDVLFVSGSGQSKDITKPNTPATHTVEPKETLYGISRKYGVSVDDIKKLNPGLGELQVGQVVVISNKGDKNNTANDKLTQKKEAENKDVEKKEIEKKETEKRETEKKQVQTVTEKPVVKTEEKKTNKLTPPVVTTRPENNLPDIKKEGYTRVNESGFAESYDAGSDFHYALHKTAPIGTIIFVENEDTGQKVYVRVMGRLTGAGAGVIMRISKKAFDKISKGDAKIKISSSYIP